MTNIPQQKQVLEDTYNILKKVATCVQHPSTVGIYTTNNKHSIKYFRYNTNPEYKGYFEHSISFEIDVDYKIEDLIKTVLTLHIENIIPKLIKEMDINIDINTIECKFYNNGICASPINKKECHCKNIPTEWCYFKQLARAKEENKELKAQLEQQKKENKEFKEKLSQVKDITEPLNSELPEDKVIREIFLIVNDCINKKVNPYKQALDSVEHICKNVLDDDYIRNLAFALLDIINKAKEE